MESLTAAEAFLIGYGVMVILIMAVVGLREILRPTVKAKNILTKRES